MSKGNLVSVVDQMMKDGAGINQIQAVVQESNAQEKRIEQNQLQEEDDNGSFKTVAQIEEETFGSKKEQDLQATSAPVESTLSDTELALENTLPESQYESKEPLPSKIKDEFVLNSDVASSLNLFDISKDEQANIIEQADEEYDVVVKEFLARESDMASAEENKNQAIGTRSKHNAKQIFSPTGGGSIWVWPDGYLET